MEFEHNNDTADKADELRKRSFINILVPVLMLVTVVVCVVLLVVVIKLDRKIDGMEEKLQAFQDNSNSDGMTVDGENSEVSDIYGNPVDQTEAADIVEAATLENMHVWDGGKDKSSEIRRVYLTFDDGPSSNTDRILDILDEYGVKATFFVVGKEGYNEQYKRIVEQGHTLGMHSYTHKYNEIYASLDAYKQDLTKLHDFLYELTGEDCDIVRFPGGSSNTISHVDMRELIAYLDEQDMVYFDWNVSSGDAARGYVSAEQIASNVLDNVGNYNNAVILFHDAADKDTTIDALPTIIEKILESENTVLLPISEDTVKVQHVH